MLKSPLCCIAQIIVLLGAIHWGLIGALNFNLVETILGSFPLLVKIIYILVGLSGLSGLILMVKQGGRCGACGKGSGSGPSSV